jgi:hypothetical protein
MRCSFQVGTERPANEADPDTQEYTDLEADSEQLGE